MTSLLIDNSNQASAMFGIRPLEAALQTVAPQAVLLRPWLLQNIIALDRGRGRSPFNVPHRSIHVIERNHLLAMSRAQGWSLPQPLPDCDTLILLARPETDWLAAHEGPRVLRHYWQLLFHARIDVELRRKLNEREIDDPAIQRRIERIGRSAFNEACFVLHRERCVPTNAALREVYAEFAAVYLELCHFRPDLLPVYFPAIAGSAEVPGIFHEDVDYESLFQQTRLPGAADAAPASCDFTPSPGTPGEGRGGGITSTVQRNTPTPALPRSTGRGNSTGATALSALPQTSASIERDARRIPQLEARADRAASLGNHVRAAILRRRVHLAGGAGKTGTDAPDLRDLDALLGRLAKALELDDRAREEWRAVLAALIVDAADGWWNPDGRLLYDLQKICIHHEREIYSVGVVDWLLEFCRRPLRRPQPNQRLALICKALRSAAHRVPHTQLVPSQQAVLSELIHAAEHHTETRLRDALRPAVSDAIKAGGLVPQNAPEQVAANKLTEELLDSVAHRGFLTLGAVRDAISSNQIKYDDIPSRQKFFAGDPLFCINRRLVDTLDGVYHRGEVYRRLFQKISSWAFATGRGRFITRTVLIPIGGSFIIVEGLDHTLFLLLGLVTGWHWFKIGWFEDYRREPLGLVLNMPFVVIALMLLGAVNWRAFRAATFRELRAIARGLGHLFIDAPRWIISQPTVQAIINSRAMLFAVRYVIKPVAIAGFAMLFVPHRATPHTHWLTFGIVFGGANLLLNSRHGRAIEQVIVHWLRVLGGRFTSDILGSLFSGVMHFFSRMLEDFERMLYAVDEWLRFREGQPRSSLVMKAALGVFWFYIAYVARFVVNLLAEPQVNPIKHFPVVTVSHKILWLTAFNPIQSAFQSLGAGVARARTITAVMLTCIPGIFGFLAWELRSNWKLYRANRPENLKPIAIGSHGETMARLLRPGFHSGTVPRLFERLRRSQRDAYQPAAGVKSHQNQEAVEHVAQAVIHFVEREFIFRLNQHPLWHDAPISLCDGEHGVRLGPTRITIALCCPALDPAPAHVFFEQRAGWILAGIDQPGWMRRTSPPQSQLLAAALLGFYKIAGVDIVKEQIDCLFSPRPVAFELSPDRITFWPDRQFDKAIVLSLDVNDEDKVAAATQPTARELLLRFVSVKWEEWVRIWDAQSDIGAITDQLHCVLPPPTTKTSS